MSKLERGLEAFSRLRLSGYIAERHADELLAIGEAINFFYEEKQRALDLGLKLGNELQRLRLLMDDRYTITPAGRAELEGGE